MREFKKLGSNADSIGIFKFKIDTLYYERFIVQ